MVNQRLAVSKTGTISIDKIVNAREMVAALHDRIG